MTLHFRGSLHALQITGFFVAIITVLATCLDAGLQGKAFLTGDVSSDIERLEEGGAAGAATKADALAYRPDWFHFCFALASMYIAMVFTGELSPGHRFASGDKGSVGKFWAHVLHAIQRSQ